MNAPLRGVLQSSVLFERHGLVWVDPGALCGLESLPSQGQSALREWAVKAPFVVARRSPADAEAGRLRLGWSGPRQHNRKPERYALSCRESTVREYRSPLTLDEVIAGLPEAGLQRARAALRDLKSELGSHPVECRVFGSYADAVWSGQSDRIHDSSDLDLLIIQDKPNPRLLAALTAWNASALGKTLPLDGEIRIRGQGDVAWKECVGRPDRVLMKSLDGLALRALETREPSCTSIDELVLLADASLALEAISYPKPGLVSSVDSGSHRDMDYALLGRAREAIRPGFYDLARVARAGGGFVDLVRIGLAMERAMLSATRGVNVYRGAIFNLGLLLAAAAVAQERNLFDVLQARFGPDILRHRSSEAHHGEHLRRTLGARGAIDEAGLGFPSLRAVLIPAWQESQSAGHDPERALIAALLASIAILEDTNLLWRGGMEGLAFAQKAANTFNAEGGVHAPDWRDKLEELHRDFVRRGLSPGGSADLAACTHFVGEWQRRYAA